MTELRADCSRCFALCCVAYAFASPADFAFEKDAGTPCPNLGNGDRCTIHDHLRPRGFSGCAAYDCFGAGQRVAQVTFGARHWRTHPSIARGMFEVLPIVRQLHELLWYLADARSRAHCVPVLDRLDSARVTIDRLASGTPDELRALDLDAVRAGLDPLLREVGELVRAGIDRPPDHCRADLIGACFAGADLRGADLRSAYLIAADLRGADLRRADVIGADLRDADLHGADLREALFLTQNQVGSARGDARTRLPDRVDRPAHWTT